MTSSETERKARKIAKILEEQEEERTPFEVEVCTWLLVIGCAPWLIFVARDWGRHGWLKWHRWRLHLIPLTYLIYFTLTALMFPTVNLVLGFLFPFLVAAGLIGFNPLVFNYWIIAAVVVLATVFLLTHLIVMNLHERHRVKVARKKITTAKHEDTENGRSDLRLIVGDNNE